MMPGSLTPFTSCGSPPPAFTNSATNGGIVVSRIGDLDDALCDANGCADGDYFMRLNVAFQSRKWVRANNEVLYCAESIAA